MPKLSRVALLWEPKNAGSAQTWTGNPAAGKELGLQFYSMEVSSGDQFEGAFKDAIQARSAALAVTPMVLAANSRKKIIWTSDHDRLPAMYSQTVLSESGGFDVLRRRPRPTTSNVPPISSKKS